MRLTLLRLVKGRPVMMGFKNYLEVTDNLQVWPQEIRIALNEGIKLKGWYIFRTMDLEKGGAGNSRTNNYTLTRVK